MKYSSFNWVERRKRGWIFGPFFGRMFVFTVEGIGNDTDSPTTSSVKKKPSKSKSA